MKNNYHNNFKIRVLKYELEEVRKNINIAIDKLDEKELYKLFKEDDKIFNEILKLQEEIILSKES